MSQRSILRSALLAGLLGLSLVLIAYGAWLLRLDHATEALHHGDVNLALTLYEKAALPAWLAPVIKADYQRLVFDHVRALSAAGRYDKIGEKLATEAAHAPFLAEAGAYAFWSGTLEFRKAIQSRSSEVVARHLRAALDDYRKALAAEPNDWDSKYNYELVKTLLSQYDSGRNEEKVRSILEKMRTIIEPAREELPPEKRG